MQYCDISVNMCDIKYMRHIDQNNTCVCTCMYKLWKYRKCMYHCTYAYDLYTECNMSKDIYVYEHLQSNPCSQVLCNSTIFPLLLLEITELSELIFEVGWSNHTVPQ